MSIEMIRMSKQSVTRLFVGAIVAVTQGSSWHRRHVGGLGERCNRRRWQRRHRRDRWIWWTALGLVIVGSLAILWTLAAVVSWIAALLNTWQLEDKAWFASLLALGLPGRRRDDQAYVVAGPDGTQQSVARPGHGGSACT